MSSAVPLDNQWSSCQWLWTENSERNRSLLVFASPSAKISEYSKGRKKENKNKKNYSKTLTTQATTRPISLVSLGYRSSENIPLGRKIGHSTVLRGWGVWDVGGEG